MKNKLVVVAFVLVGCGGGGSGVGTHFSTSVSGSAPVAGLSGPQQAQLCSDIQHFASSVVTADVCKAEAFLAAALLEVSNSAATNADLQSACNAAFSDCVNAAADAGPGTCDFSTLDPATCTATVAQVSACLNDLGAQDDRLVAQFPSCSSVTAQSITNSASTAPPDAGSSTAASCVTLDSVCPGAVTTITKM